MAPLSRILVVDLTRYLPGPYASRELLRLGARVIHLEPPEGDPMRSLAPAWYEAINAGKQSVVCDLKADPDFGRELCARADVVLEGFRPGVAERLGVGYNRMPRGVIYCSISGYGSSGPNAHRAGHDLNYQGYAGVLADTAPGLPPVQVADLAGGALVAVSEILAALLEREQTGRGRRIELSLTHGAHRLVAHRTMADPLPRLLTGGLASYAIYETSDGRHLTVGALEPRFFQRLCELIGRSELAERQYDPDAQDDLAAALAEAFATKTLGDWLELCDGKDVSVGPVATVAEAAADFGVPDPPPAPALGQHTEAWRRELGG